MVEIRQPGSVFSFLSGVSFTVASLFSDILLIRLSLLCAYVFLLVTGALGIPSWPGVSSDGAIGLEAIVFSSINIVTHGIAIIRLIYDERNIRFGDEREEQMWRFLYRRGGFERLEAREVIRRGAFREVAAGDVVLAEDEASEKVCILMKGCVAYQRRRLAAAPTAESELESPVTGTLLSGSIFDIRLLSIFGVYTGFDDPEIVKGFSATAVADCLVFELGLAKMDELTTRCGPACAIYFRNFVLCDLALQLEYRVDGHQHARSSDGVPEDDAWRGGAMSRDFTDAVLDERGPPEERTVCGRIFTFCRWIYQSFSWLVPPGVRHVGLRGLPRTGRAARRRLQALHAAKARAELVRARNQPKEVGLLKRLSSRLSRRGGAD